MREEDEEERDHLGLPERRGPWRPVVGPTEPRVAGLPTRWLRPGAGVDLRAVRHPFRFLRWRLGVRRLGPYAPDFDEVDEKGRKEPGAGASP